MKYIRKWMPCPRCGAEEAALVSARFVSAEANPMADEDIVQAWLWVRKKPPVDPNDNLWERCYECGLKANYSVPRIVVLRGHEDEVMEQTIENIWEYVHEKCLASS